MRVGGCDVARKRALRVAIALGGARANSVDIESAPPYSAPFPCIDLTAGCYELCSVQRFKCATDFCEHQVPRGARPQTICAQHRQAKQRGLPPAGFLVASEVPLATPPAASLALRSALAVPRARLEARSAAPAERLQYASHFHLEFPQTEACDCARCNETGFGLASCRLTHPPSRVRANFELKVSAGAVIVVGGGDTSSACAPPPAGPAPPSSVTARERTSSRAPPPPPSRAKASNVR